MYVVVEEFLYRLLQLAIKYVVACAMYAIFVCYSYVNWYNLVFRPVGIRISKFCTILYNAVANRCQIELF